MIRRFRKPRVIETADPKPLRVTVELPDGQWRTWKLGPGDAVGLGGIKVEAQGSSAVLVTTYDEDSQA